MIDPVLTIAAALSVQSPFTSKAHSNYDAMVRNTYINYSVCFKILNETKTKYQQTTHSKMNLRT